MSDNDLVTFSYILNDINYDHKTDKGSKSKRRLYIKNKLDARLEKKSSNSSNSRWGI